MDRPRDELAEFVAGVDVGGSPRRQIEGLPEDDPGRPSARRRQQCLRCLRCVQGLQVFSAFSLASRASPLQRCYKNRRMGMTATSRACWSMERRFQRPSRISVAAFRSSSK